MTGGAGFIGSHFVVSAIHRNSVSKVTVLDSLELTGNLSNLSEVQGDFNFVRGDIRDGELVDSLVSKNDVVINFAAQTHNDNSLRDPKRFFETNVLGTHNLAYACVTHSKRFHHISTDEVFGDLDLDSESLFSETSAYRPSSPYSASKASSDHLIRSYVRSFGLAATLSNCSNNFGEKQHWEKLIPNSIKHLVKHQPVPIFGDGKNMRDWIHVSDHVSGIWKVLEQGKTGETYLFGSSDVQSNIDVVTKIAEILGVDLDKAIKFVLDRPGHDKKYAIDWSISREKLGWEPKQASIIENLVPTVDWYKSRLLGPSA